LQFFSVYCFDENSCFLDSQSGHYIPQLAEAMVEYNTKDKIFNLKGIAVRAVLAGSKTSFFSKPIFFSKICLTKNLKLV